MEEETMYRCDAAGKTCFIKTCLHWRAHTDGADCAHKRLHCLMSGSDVVCRVTKKMGLVEKLIEKGKYSPAKPVTLEKMVIK